MEHSCGLYILNKNNELLIVHPTLHKPNINWGIPKGKIDGDETYLETAVRETKEETNLDIINELLSGNIEKSIELPISIYKSGKKVLHSFYLKINNFDSNTQLSCPNTFDYKGKQLPENNDFKWININDPELDKIMHEAQISNLQIIRKYINNEKQTEITMLLNIILLTLINRFSL